MLRKVVRVFALISLIGSVVIGGFATYVWLTPSDEEKLYDQAHLEAMQKLQRAEAARGTPAEARLAKEAREAADSASVWGRGYRERLAWNRLGVLASGGVALLSFVIFLLTFIKRKNNAEILHNGTWDPHNQNLGYSGQSGLDSRQTPR